MIQPNKEQIEEARSARVSLRIGMGFLIAAMLVLGQLVWSLVVEGHSWWALGLLFPAGVLWVYLKAMFQVLREETKALAEKEADHESEQ